MTTKPTRSADANASAGVPVALTIAGSDSGGGAGIQADLRTFAAFGVHGASAITALTAQSTVEVRDVLPVPAAFVRAQVETVLDDLDVRAAKTGMLHNEEVVLTVAALIAERGLLAVVDPVMVASSGARLLEPAAEAAVRERLVPRGRLITPNVPEAEVLLGRPIDPNGGAAAMIDAAKDLIERLGARAVLMKGGHLPGDPIDVFADAEAPGGLRLIVLASTRIETRATHGTGCTTSAAIAALLARGASLGEAVARAHAYVHEAILAASLAPPIGHGFGPVHHLHPYFAWAKGG